MAQKSNGDFEVGGAVLPMRRYTAILATIGPNGTGSITIPNVDPFPPPENPVYGIAVLSDTQRVWAGKSDEIEGDPSGNRGFQPTNLGAEAGVSDIVVQPDGKAVMLMYGSASFSLTRVNPDGSLDGTFGNRGMSKASLADTGELDRQVKYAQELILLPDGRILAAGTVNSVSHSPSHGMVVARFGADGRLDSTFGKGGFSIVNSVSDDFYLTHTRVAVDGKIVIAGGEIRVRDQLPLLADVQRAQQLDVGRELIDRVVGHQIAGDEDGLRDGDGRAGADGRCRPGQPPAAGAQLVQGAHVVDGDLVGHAAGVADVNVGADEERHVELVVGGRAHGYSHQEQQSHCDAKFVHGPLSLSQQVAGTVLRFFHRIAIFSFPSPRPWTRDAYSTTTSR
jgi:uncharacterized delta-60 repeat protein